MLPVIVKDNNVEKALRVWKRKVQREGVNKEQKKRRFFTKGSEKRKKKKNEAVRRVKKNLRTRMLKEGY